MVHSSHQMLAKTTYCTFSRLIFVGMYCCLKTTSAQPHYTGNTSVPVSIYYPDSEPDCLKVPVHLTPVSVLIRNQENLGLLAHG